MGQYSKPRFSHVYVEQNISVSRVRCYAGVLLARRGSFGQQEATYGGKVRTALFVIRAHQNWAQSRSMGIEYHTATCWRGRRCSNRGGTRWIGHLAT